MAGLLTAETVFFLACALVLMGALAAILSVRPEAGLLLVALAMALTINLRFSRGGEVRSSLVVDVGGLSVSLLDVLAVVMLMIVAFRRLSRGSARAWELVVWALIVLSAINAFRGIPQFGLEQTVNEVRPWLYLLAATLFCGLVTVTRPMRLTLAVGLAAYVGWLAAVAVVGFWQTGLNTVTAETYVGNELVDPRPVSASGGLVLAEALMLFVAFRSRLGRPVRWVVLLTIGLIVVFLQHRTVWVAVAVALAYVSIVALRTAGAGRARTVAALVAATGLGTAVILTGALRNSVLAGSVNNAIGEDNTLSWRILGWQQLIGGDRDLLDVALGEPFGRGFLRVVNDVALTVSAHSQYVSTYLRLGVLGLGCLVWLMVLAWRGVPVAAAQLQVSPILLRGLLVTLVLYGSTYSWDPFQGVVLGLLLALSRTPARPADGGPATLPARTAPPSRAANDALPTTVR